MAAQIMQIKHQSTGHSKSPLLAHLFLPKRHTHTHNNNNNKNNKNNELELKKIIKKNKKSGNAPQDISIRNNQAASPKKRGHRLSSHVPCHIHFSQSLPAIPVQSSPLVSCRMQPQKRPRLRPAVSPSLHYTYVPIYVDSRSVQLTSPYYSTQTRHTLPFSPSYGLSEINASYGLLTRWECPRGK